MALHLVFQGSIADIIDVFMLLVVEIEENNVLGVKDGLANCCQIDAIFKNACRKRVLLIVGAETFPFR